MSVNAIVQGGVSLDITANTDRLIAALERSRGKVRTWASHLTNITSSVAKPFTTLAGLITKAVTSFGLLAGAGALVGAGAAARNWLAWADSISKAARRLNVATEELSVWDHMLRKSDVSLEQFEKSIVFLRRQLAAPSDEFVAVLERLGMVPEQLRSMPALDAMADLFRRIETLVPDEVEREGLLQVLFGKGGHGLLNLINGFNDQLADANREASRLGKTHGDLAERLNDSFTTLQRKLTEFGGTLVSLLEPIITNLVDGFTSLVQQAERVVEYIRQLSGMQVLYLLAEMFRAASEGRWDRLIEGLQLLWNMIKAQLIALWQAILDGLVAVVNMLLARIHTMVRKESEKSWSWLKITSPTLWLLGKWWASDEAPPQLEAPRFHTGVDEATQAIKDFVAAGEAERAGRLEQQERQRQLERVLESEQQFLMQFDAAAMALVREAEAARRQADRDRAFWEFVGLAEMDLMSAAQRAFGGVGVVSGALGGFSSAALMLNEAASLQVERQMLAELKEVNEHLAELEAKWLMDIARFQ